MQDSPPVGTLSKPCKKRDGQLTGTVRVFPHSFLAIAGKLLPLGKGINMAGGLIAAILAGAFAMNNLPSLARCVLHVRAVTRNPSAFRFYLRGILREFANPFGEFILAGSLLIVLIQIINLIY